MKEDLISIIIPTFNEESRILEVIENCRALMPQPELIVCDGGSSDRTVARAAAAGARTLRCRRRGRSFQMNDGARAAAGGTLVFLHADSRIGQEAWGALGTALRNPTVQFGAFRRRFEPPRWLLNAGSYLASWRGRAAGIFLGDQAIFVRTETFRRIGGYKEVLLFEDVDLCVRLGKVGRSTIIPAYVVTSSRRFLQEGELRRFCRNTVLWFRYWLGADPNELASIYYPGYYDASASEQASNGTEPRSQSIEMEIE